MEHLEHLEILSVLQVLCNWSTWRYSRAPGTLQLEHLEHLEVLSMIQVLCRYAGLIHLLENTGDPWDTYSPEDRSGRRSRGHVRE